MSACTKCGGQLRNPSFVDAVCRTCFAAPFGPRGHRGTRQYWQQYGMWWQPRGLDPIGRPGNGLGLVRADDPEDAPVTLAAKRRAGMFVADPEREAA